MLFGLVAYNCSEGLSSSSLPFHVKDSKLTKNQWIDQLWKESQEALRLAVKLNPGNGDAQAELANFLLHDQRSRSRNEILRCLEIALKKAPESSRVQYIAGQAYSLVTEPYYNPVKAEQHLRKTVALQPDYSPAYATLVHLYTYEIKDYQKASQALKKYFALVPQSKQKEENWIAIKNTIDSLPHR